MTEGHSRGCGGKGQARTQDTLQTDLSHRCRDRWIQAPIGTVRAKRSTRPIPPALLPGSASRFSPQNLPHHLAQQPSPLPPFQESLGLSDPEAGHTSQITSEDSFYRVRGQTYTKSDHPAARHLLRPGKPTPEDPPPRPPSRVGSIQTLKNPRRELGNETSRLINTSILRALQPLPCKGPPGRFPLCELEAV